MPKPELLAAAIGIALCGAVSAQVAPNTLPSAGSVVSGSAVISTPAPARMQIDQSSPSAIINWGGFSIGSAAHVNFSQPNASSVALNRVVGSNPSEIFGRLTANGQVFLTNANGVLFAPGASVEVGSLFASSLSINNDDFLAGRYRFSREGNPGSVVNQGTIVTPNGYAVLAGPQVRNEGLIVARLGSVALAAGDRVSLDMIGDGLINVAVHEAALNASVVNTGTIQADGGRIILTARSANALLDTVINSSGVLRANSLVERNGEILLEAASGSIAVSGPIEAVGGSITLRGGSAVIISNPSDVTTGNGSITIDAGQLIAGGCVSSGGSVDPCGTAVPIAGGSTTGTVTLNVGGNSTVLPGGSAAVITLVQEAARLAAIRIQTSIETALVVTDFRTNSRGVGSPVTGDLTGPVGLVAPLQHQIDAVGISIPAGVTLPPQ